MLTTDQSRVATWLNTIVLEERCYNAVITMEFHWNSTRNKIEFHWKQNGIPPGNHFFQSPETIKWYRSRTSRQVDTCCRCRRDERSGEALCKLVRERMNVGVDTSLSGRAEKLDLIWCVTLVQRIGSRGRTYCRTIGKRMASIQCTFSIQYIVCLSRTLGASHKYSYSSLFELDINFYIEFGM